MSTTRQQPVTCRHTDSANFTTTYRHPTTQNCDTTYHHPTAQNCDTTYRLTNDAKFCRDLPPPNGAKLGYGSKLCLSTTGAGRSSLMRPIITSR